MARLPKIEETSQKSTLPVKVNPQKFSVKRYNLYIHQSKLRKFSLPTFLSRERTKSYGGLQKNKHLCNLVDDGKIAQKLRKKIAENGEVV